MVEFQSTHPRGVRQLNHKRLSVALEISIHAPAWGATKTCSKAGQPAGISIHAPAWGATFLQGIYHRLQRISIHAPAWGATHLAGYRDNQADISIHAPAWGATADGLKHLHMVLISIHAPAWGATVLGFALVFIVVHFNPRTRVGCDLIAVSIGCFILSFQSTHPRGVRLFNFFPNIRCGARFQSTHPRGVRHISCQDPALLCDFNPRTRVGCDLTMIW